MLQRLFPLVLAALCVASPAYAVDKVACKITSGPAAGAVTTCPGDATLNGTLTANGLTVPGGLAVQGFGAAGTPTGDLITVQGDPAGTPVPVSAAALPLPTGAATAAKQDTGNASLNSIDAILLLLNAKFGALGQQLAAASAPVVLPAAQIALLTQASQLPASLVGGRLDVNVGASTPLSVTGPLTDTQLRATPVPVSGTVTASGGATSANQTNGTQKTQVVDGSGNVQPAGDSVTRPIYQARVGASAFQLLTGLTAGTTLRSGVGTLRKMCVFIPSSGGTGGFYVYDNTAASGTAIVSLFTTTSTCYDLDVRFGNGLTVQMTTAAATVLMTWDTY